jgi:hypothetical protein
MSDKTGGPAFPHARPSMNQHGMTLRDWFAGQALAGAVANQLKEPTRQERFEAIATQAYRFADAMLTVREKGGGE